MRLRAAHVLLLSLCWHLLLPAAGFAALDTNRHEGQSISAPKETPPSAWMPRNSDANDLTRLPDRQPNRLLLQRSQSVGAVAAAAATRSLRLHTAPQPIYPERSRLHRHSATANDGDASPA